MSATDVIQIAISPIGYTALSAGKRKARYAADGTPWPPPDGNHLDVATVAAYSSPAQMDAISHTLRLMLVRLQYVPNTPDGIEHADELDLANAVHDLNPDLFNQVQAGTFTAPGLSDVDHNSAITVALYNAVSDGYAARFAR